ncbi:hypothetical protein U9M48_041862 [Paspalum notatum var. saurae]|uniref:Benzyl alcohol O-benzoyltransferase n=1 Tax=Paspalum notatum var. saurae TaxID=547442 RepID=A0AAQ3XEP1_PASNO
MSTTLITFAVRRQEPELVGPAAPTPRETKRLSDIDDQNTLRRHVRFVFFYRGGCGSPGAGDPVRVIRRAIGEALVPYYPLAGRLREEAGTRKLVVDCTGEGVLFVEADADVRMAELEAAGPLRPPFPCLDQLLFDVDGSAGVLHCPLVLIQVTRLLCGGFVVATRLNHTMFDAAGIAQFISAVAELSRGSPAAPTVAPAWSRELLEARRIPPLSSKPVFRHREYDAVPARPPPPGPMVMRTFTFSARDVAAIKKHLLPPRLRDTAPTTSFEVLVAVLWRASTAALGLAPDEVVRLAIAADCRRLRGLGLPDGYYGNAIVLPTAATTAGALVGGSLCDAVELVREAKAAVTAEYVRSVVDLLVRCGRPDVVMGRPDVFIVSDHRRAGFHRVDFGWGMPVFGGSIGIPAPGGCFLIAVANGDGEEAVAVPITLPRPAMDRFASEIKMALTLPLQTTSPTIYTAT